jgi:hypothetical protein
MVENVMIYASKMTRLQEDHAGASVRTLCSRCPYGYSSHFICTHARPSEMSLGDSSRRMRGRVSRKIE